MSAILVRQARRWIAQEQAGNLPDGVYDALADGRSSGYEKRVIRNLARRSRIITDDSTIRPYSEFSADWTYTRSIYGHTRKCELCGHDPIVENCVLVNSETDDEMLIGNTCVIRYIEIRDESGRVLNDDEKSKFLKGEMSEAKAEFNRQEFAARYPNALFDLKRFEPLMKSRKKTRTLHKLVSNRLVKYGYLGKKTRNAWDDFMADAQAEQDAYDAYKAQKALEKAQEQAVDGDRKAAFTQRLTERRNQFHLEGQEWLETALEIEDQLNSWESKMIGRVLNRITTSGLDSLSGGFGRFHEEVLVRVNMKNGITPPMPPMGVALQKALDTGTLNEWEQGFCESVLPRLATGRSLSTAQQEVVEKILKVETP